MFPIYKNEKKSRKFGKIKLWKNLVSSFFVRIIICGVLLSMFWGWIVYIYQVRQIKSDLFLRIEKVSHSLITGQGISFNNIDSTVFENFIVVSEHQLLDYHVVSLTLLDNEKHSVFQYANTTNDLGVHKDGNKKWNLFPSGDQEKHSFFKIGDKVCFHLFEPVKESHKQLGYINIVVEVGPRIVRQFGRAIIVAMLHTSGTIAMMALILYPLIHTSYRKLQQNGRELTESHLQTIKALGNAIAERDSDTDQHNYRVAYFSLCLAEHLNLSGPSLLALVKGAFLHDIGKLGVRDNILLKPSDLTAEEFATMKTHVEQGVRIIKDIPWLSDSMDVIRYHHERYDGSGYPLGIAKETIPMIARIFAMVDVFDALISNRPYKNALSYQDAIEILRKNKKQFDPLVFSHFMEISEKLYTDSITMTKLCYENYLKTIFPIHFRKNGSFI